jgi:hypothetical protein
MKHQTVVALAICISMNGAFAARAADAVASTSVNAGYDAMKTLPDWSGAWGQDQTPPAPGKPLGLDQKLAEIPPLKDQAALAKYKASLDVIARGGDNIARGGGGIAGTGALHPVAPNGIACEFYGGTEGAFTGRNPGGPETLLEFLFSLGRVTITSDHGFIRRIYTDGRKMPADPFITTSGTSMGHWEGNVLVVETAGLSPKTLLTGNVPAGQNFRVSERFYLDDQQKLHVDSELTAPDTLTGPYKITMRYRRLPDRNYMLAEYVTDCEHHDRAVDPVAKRQIFDLTPPKDLPPPPH